jgi:pilus assembly protein CpaC
VPGEQQVQLRVIVAEVNRAAARSIGMNFAVRNNQGLVVFTQNTGNIAGFGFGGGGFGVGGFAGFGVPGFGGLANLTAQFDGGKIPFAITALRTLDYARSLAEPTLVTLNGQTANFLAGGQFPVPVVTGTTFAGLQGVQYVPFGVLLNFTPFITDRDRIRLNLSATVSARDIGTAANIGGATVAGLNSRTVNTTVELRQGETLAVAGLIQTNLGAQAARVPLLGDLPGLGMFFGLNRVEAGEKELVIFITPELARPLDCGQLPPLPGSEILDPTDVEFYLLTRLEGHCRDYRSPIRTDWSRIRQYHLLEQAHIAGPSGYTNWP